MKRVAIKVVIVNSGQDLAAYASADADVYVVDLTWPDQDGVVMNDGKPLPLEGLEQFLTDFAKDLDPSERRKLVAALELS